MSNAVLFGFTRPGFAGGLLARLDRFFDVIQNLQPRLERRHLSKQILALVAPLAPELFDRHGRPDASPLGRRRRSRFFFRQMLRPGVAAGRAFPALRAFLVPRVGGAVAARWRGRWFLGWAHRRQMSHRFRMMHHRHEKSRPGLVGFLRAGNPDEVAGLAQPVRRSEHRDLIFALRAFHPVIAIV
jgi:hypothetical protein